MKLILFDLDGTLLTSQGIGRESTKAALESVYGTSGNLDAFYPGGRTQEAIFLDTLLDAGYSQAQFLEKRDQLYDFFLTDFAERAQEDHSRIKPLPGAIELINALTAMSEYQLGIVTGNHYENAVIKLSTAGFNPDWFSIGAYGQESADRAELVLLAVERTGKLTGVDTCTVVVGDTTRDVESAYQADAVSIALATGTHGPDLLKSANPDFLLEGLDDLQSFLDILENINC